MKLSAIFRGIIFCRGSQPCLSMEAASPHYPGGIRVRENRAGPRQPTSCQLVANMKTKINLCEKITTPSRATFWMKTFFLSIAGLTLLGTASFAQTDINGPMGSGTFGTTVTVLPNGNFVVTDPTFSIPSGAANVGAVYLYDGATLALVRVIIYLTNQVEHARILPSW